MRITLIAIGLFLCALGTPQAGFAQVGAWQRVEALPVGTRVLVGNLGHVPCVIAEVNDYALGCSMHGWVYWVERSRITRVSRTRSAGAALLGGLAGAAAGGSWSAAASGSQTAGRGLRILVSAAVGAGAGYLVGHVFDDLEGEVLYVRP